MIRGTDGSHFAAASLSLLCDFVRISSVFSEHRPLSFDFIFKNGEESQVRSGE